MPPAAHSYNEWMENDASRFVVDCLLPTGILIPLTVEKDATVEEIKERLWKEAQHYPLFNSLRAKLSYVFQCVTSMAEKVELEDESRPLLEMKPFQPILKVVERKGNKMEKISNLRISMLIGKGLHEFDNLKSTEVSDFRQTMRLMCEKIAKDRDNKPQMERLRFMCPVDLADEPGFPKHISDRLTDKKLTIMVRQLDNQSVFTFQVFCTTKPIDLISMVIDKRRNLTGVDLGDKDKYLLKVCGREEFLHGDHPFSQFMYIRRTVTKGDISSVVLVEKDKLLESNLPTPAVDREYREGSKKPPPPLLKPQKPAKGHMKKASLWDMTDKYSIKLHNVTNASIEDFPKLFLKACIYHGSDAMCSVQTSKEVMVNQGLVSWEEDLTFDIALQDIPRMARLCFVLFSIKERRNKGDKRNTEGGKKKKRNKLNAKNQHDDYTFPVSWINIPLFDYKDVLRTGPCKLYMWPVSDDDSLSDGEARLHPMGTVESNPMSSGAVCLSFHFNDYNTNCPIYYPPFEQVLEVAAKHTDFLGNKDTLINSNANFRERMSTIMLDKSKNVTQQHLEQLRSMVEKDPLTQLYDQEKQLIWMLRYECQHHFPNSLPRLLRCVKWDYHIDVAQVQALLQIWPVLQPGQVLELLDFDYADKSVRKYAVKCLKNMSDQQLSQYLLQFVQVLKYETYLECDLVHFLLERALNNRHIGHRLFWMLRSEMHVPSVSVRFGLILEAYCRGSAHHIEDLSKQTIALDKMKTLSVNIKKGKSREQAKEDLKHALEDPTYFDALSGISNTLDPCYKLKYPRAENCRVMDSKMKPLWLVFENHDVFGDPVNLMYKNGDDLRQDMLTLQILRIIDSIWQDAGLDLRLNAYGCLSTAHSEGLIQVVSSSNTIANIQKDYAGMKIKSAFNKQSLYEYLYKHNDSEDKLQKAIQEFTLSCAGYSVAMYVLGVADRHGDNILLREDGQLFHIDFGHFLGHFKTKAGINREPAPFMLTSDFVYVIQRGPAKSHKAFSEFKSTCERAYMALREKCNFLMSLLLMMMNTGIPELSKVEDIEYLKRTLQPHLKEEDARRHFNKQWNIALKNAWKVAVNNTFHNMMRDNN